MGAPFKLARQAILYLCVGISCFTTGLIINAAQLLIFLIIKPFNKRLFRHLMYYLCYSFHSHLLFLADWWSGCKLKVYVSPEDLATCGSEHGLLIMNHRYEIDWLLGWMFCDKVGVLGNCKAFAKKVIQYVPTIGWSWKLAEFVFLERDINKDRLTIGPQIRNVLDYPDAGWLLLNAEGTRFSAKKHEASVKFAQERGIPVLKHHLIPRTKGFTLSLPHLREKCPNIYDVNLVVRPEDYHKATIPGLLNREKFTAYMYFRRIPTSSVPEDEAKAAEWLHELFRQKDAIQESFHKHGDFFHGTGIKPMEPIEFKPRLAVLLNTVFWACSTLIPMLYYLTTLLLSGHLYQLTVAIGILALFYALIYKAIAMSKISKASDYGASNAAAAGNHTATNNHTKAE